MTFSIVARSADGRSHGVAVASKFLAVGAAVPAAEADIGALATQSYANLAYRPQGLALLRTGVSAADVVAGLTAADPGRDQRQLGVVGATGDGATYTGSGCHDWAGGIAGDGTPSRATSWPASRSWSRWWRRGRPATRPRRWPAGYSPRSPPATGPAATGVAGRARHSWWSPRDRATGGPRTSWPACRGANTPR